jgi:hypothetical protein
MTTKGTPVATLAELLPSETRMVRNILKTYRSATDAQRLQGMTWYDTAHALAVDLDPQNVTRAAGVISALSPRETWEVNQRLAIRLYVDGPLTTGTLPDSIRKANAIYGGADVATTLNGKKTVAFAATIADPADPFAVVVDRHAVSVALARCSADADASVLSRKGGYEWYADAYRKAAKRAGVSPSQMQATTWVVWRQTAIRTAANNVRLAA